MPLGIILAGIRGNMMTLHTPKIGSLMNKTTKIPPGKIDQTVFETIAELESMQS